MVQGAKIFQGKYVTPYILRLFLSTFFAKMDVFLKNKIAVIKVFIIVYSEILCIYIYIYIPRHCTKP